VDFFRGPERGDMVDAEVPGEAVPAGRASPHTPRAAGIWGALPGKNGVHDPMMRVSQENPVIETLASQIAASGKPPGLQLLHRAEQPRVHAPHEKLLRGAVGKL